MRPSEFYDEYPDLRGEPMTYDEWLRTELERVGTHWATCYESHPACAVLAERKRIVAWLRNRQNEVLTKAGYSDSVRGAAAIVLAEIADAIERGEHTKEDA